LLTTAGIQPLFIIMDPQGKYTLTSAFQYTQCPDPSVKFGPDWLLCLSVWKQFNKAGRTPGSSSIILHGINVLSSNWKYQASTTLLCLYV